MFKIKKNSKPQTIMDRKKVINAFYLYVNKKICVFGPQDSSKFNIEPKSNTGQSINELENGSSSYRQKSIYFA